MWFTLPPLEGEVQVEGLSGPVDILRDRWGVPQVFAGTEQDLFFAQGYVHAQDRLFQMELQRRAGKGRLSELLGDAPLEFDRLSRTMEFARIAEGVEEHCSPEVLKALNSYSAGVNTFINSGPLPPEFHLLRHKPEPWTPSDTAAWSVVMAWNLSTNWEAELARLSLSTTAHTGHPVDERPGYPDDKPLQARENLIPYLHPGSASNNWAVSPWRSASGSALLANDPHLGIGIPGVWYEIGLCAGRYEVVGASLPGAPGVVIGHNKHIAWGITAALTDVQDLYIERFAPDHQLRYKFRGEWREAEVREEEIKIRRRRPFRQRVRTTVHGPVISDVFDGGQDLALRWAAPDPSSMLEAVLGLNRAGNWDGFLTTLSRWSVPGQNFVYADRNGNIGYTLAGPVPIRPRHKGDSPVPGESGIYEWDGYLPFEQLPKVFNPGNGYVASANNPPLPVTHPNYISGEYDIGYRARRITELLQGTALHTRQSFSHIQGDLYCAPAHGLAQMLGDLEPSDTISSYLLKELQDWDGVLTAESRPGAIARAALDHLLRQEPPTHPNELKLSRLLTSGAYVESRLPSVLQTLRDNSKATDTLRESLENAILKLKEILGNDPRRWSWGALHRAEFRHPLGVSALKYLLNRGGPRGYPMGGDAHTPQQAAFRPDGTYSPVTNAPTYRQVIDTGNWENSWSMSVPGQSGNPASPHYCDSIHPWLNLEYRPMVFGRKMAETAAYHHLILKPNS